MVFTQGCHLTVAALLLFTAACGSTEKEIDPYEVQPIVNKLNSAAAKPDDSSKAARAEAELQSAEVAWRSGDALTTLAIVNHAMQAGIPTSMEGAFRDLRAKARSSVISSKVCRVRLIPEKDAVPDGTAVPVRLEFANISSAVLSVPRAEKGTSNATVIVKLLREDFDIFGNTRSFDYSLPVAVGEDLVLKPGETHSTRLTIPTDMAKLSHEGFSVLTLSGSFRPVVLRVGESEFFDAIPIDSAKVRVFLKGYEQLAGDPLGSLKKAIAKRSPPHILIATELLAPADRAEARTALEAAKENDQGLTTVANAALARLGPPR